jgi:hypothetical protein
LGLGAGVQKAPAFLPGASQLASRPKLEARGSYALTGPICVKTEHPWPGRQNFILYSMGFGLVAGIRREKNRSQNITKGS